MEITALGHAGLRVRGTGTTGLIDPWLTTRGAFLGSWHQLPANDHLATRDVLTPDWVVVTHDHQDHLDLATLEQIPGGTPVFVPEYASKRLVRLLLCRTRLRVVEVQAWAHVPLDDSGSWLTFIPEQSPMGYDAAVLVSIDDVSLLDCSDARLTTSQVLRASLLTRGVIDVMTVQTNCESWYPICYEYPEALVAEISARERRAKLMGVLNLLRATSPKWAVPFAGPPCFLDPKLARHNQPVVSASIAPDQQQAAGWLAARLPGQAIRTLLPGDRFLPADGLVVEDPRWTGFCFSRLRRYLRDYARARAVDLSRVHTSFLYPDDSLGERFAEHFRRLGELGPSLPPQHAMTVRFEVDGPGGGRWDIHLGPERIEVDLKGRSRGSQYRLRIASRWLAPIVDGLISWEELLLSRRFSAWRHPAVQHDPLISLLTRADHDALRAVEAPLWDSIPRAARRDHRRAHELEPSIR